MVQLISNFLSVAPCVKKNDETLLIPTGLMRQMGVTFTLVKTPTTNASSAATRNM